MSPLDHRIAIPMTELATNVLYCGDNLDIPCAATS